MLVFLLCCVLATAMASPTIVQTLSSRSTELKRPEELETMLRDRP